MSKIGLKAALDFLCNLDCNLNINVDLDEPVHLIDRTSNILNVIADDKADDADKIASITSGF